MSWTVAWVAVWIGLWGLYLHTLLAMRRLSAAEAAAGVYTGLGRHFVRRLYLICGGMVAWALANLVVGLV